MESLTLASSWELAELSLETAVTLTGAVASKSLEQLAPLHPMFQSRAWIFKQLILT